MITLAFLLLGLALVAAQAYAASARPLPVTEALPVACLGLAWRRIGTVGTRQGERTLWVGDGADEVFTRAYKLARDQMRSVGFAWGKENTSDWARQLVPVCWETPPGNDRAVEQVLAEVERVLALDAGERAFVEAQRRRTEDLDATLNGDARLADMAFLRRSLDVDWWAWSPRKKKLAEALVKDAAEPGSVPRAGAARLARDLVAEVDYTIATVKDRVAKTPAYDWLERAQDPDVRKAVLVGVKVLCGFDEDRASIRNDHGWGKSHSHAGHALGSLSELSVIEASQALAAVHRHRKQLRPALREACFGSAEA